MMKLERKEDDNNLMVVGENLKVTYNKQNKTLRVFAKNKDFGIVKEILEYIEKDQ